MKGASQIAQYYENLYRDNREYVADPTLVGALHRVLRRWEAYRTQVVSGLLRPGGTLLDVGCGDGDLLRNNLGRFKTLYGIDVAANRVQRGHDAGIPNIRVDVGNVDAGLPYRDSSFDAVTCIAVLEHVLDPEALVSEIARVLRPGGQVVVEVPNVAFLSRRIGLLFGNMPRTAFNEPGWDGGHLHYFTFDALEGLLASRGIAVEIRTCAGIGHQLRAIRPQLLGADIILVGAKHQ